MRALLVLQRGWGGGGGWLGQARKILLVSILAFFLWKQKGLFGADYQQVSSEGKSGQSNHLDTVANITKKRHGGKADSSYHNPQRNEDIKEGGVRADSDDDKRSGEGNEDVSEDKDLEEHDKEDQKGEEELDEEEQEEDAEEEEKEEWKGKEKGEGELKDEADKEQEEDEELNEEEEELDGEEEELDEEEEEEREEEHGEEGEESKDDEEEEGDSDTNAATNPMDYPSDADGDKQKDIDEKAGDGVKKPQSNESQGMMGKVLTD